MASKVLSSALSRRVAASSRRIRIAGGGRHLGSAAEEDLSEDVAPKWTDEEILADMRTGALPQYRLESETEDATRAVKLRRQWLQDERAAANGKGGAGYDCAEVASVAVDGDDFGPCSRIPHASFDHEHFYDQVLGTNCESVIGFVPIPVGVVGPVVINDVSYHVPMATTEGALLASTNRGARAIAEAGGATTALFGDGMTRAPAVRMSSAKSAVELANWIHEEQNFLRLKEAFESTTAYGKLQEVKCHVAGRNVYLRFKCQTGDAMGMNMISKGVLHSMTILETLFPDMHVVSISGNVCIDKKPSAINWIEGRGKSVVAEVVLPRDVVENVLKCTVESLVDLNVAKNLIGSALAGSIGGNNAHASNIVTALFLATGQDPAQNVESSNCMTLFEAVPSADGSGLPDVHCSVTMPCIEVGTVGGGTSLEAQRACLELLGIAGASMGEGAAPGDNARRLASVVAGTVLAGELSLMSALASNHLVSAHMDLNRK